MRRPLFVVAVVVAVIVLFGILRGTSSEVQPSRDWGQKPVGTLPRIKEYQLIVADDSAALQNAVNKALEDKWVPHGGVTQQANGKLTQPMVKD